MIINNFNMTGFLCLDSEYDDYVATNFNGRVGEWVDLINQPTNVEFNNDHVDWYLIEYGGMDGETFSGRVASDVEYLDDDGLVGVVGIDRTKDLAPYRARLMERTPS